MKTASQWKLTFDPSGSALVICDFGDWIEGELRFPLERGVEVEPLIDAEAPFLRLSGNAVVRTQIDVYEDKTSDASARAAVLDSLISVESLGKKPLRIQIYGRTDQYWQFAEAVISSHNPGRHMESLAARLVKSYSIIATGLSKTTIP